MKENLSFPYFWIPAGLAIVATLFLVSRVNRIPDIQAPGPEFAMQPKKRLTGDAGSLSAAPFKRREPAPTDPLRNESNPDDVALQEAFVQIRVHGDFTKLGTILATMEEVERIEILVGSLKYLNSRLGNAHDVHEKIILIERFGGKVTEFAKSMVMHDLGSRLDPNQDTSLIQSLDTGSWKSVAKGAAEANPQQAFGLLAAELSSQQAETLIAEATRTWLGLDSIGASQFVSDMPDGFNKDRATVELVRWLISRGETDDARKWLSSVRNSKLIEEFDDSGL